jgi:hypothetical protein
MKHSHTPLLIFAVSVFLVVSALYAYMFHATSVSVTRAGLARDIVATEENDQTQAKLLSVVASDTKLDRARLLSFFIPSDNVVYFITTLENLGSQSGTKLNLTSVDSDSLTNSPIGTMGKAHAHIDASGSWNAVMKLLALSERMPFATSISNVRLNLGLVDAKSTRTWNISFDVESLVLVLPTAFTTSTTTTVTSSSSSK